MLAQPVDLKLVQTKIFTNAAAGGGAGLEDDVNAFLSGLATSASSRVDLLLDVQSYHDGTNYVYVITYIPAQ